jgi:hypothetical protein
MYLSKSGPMDFNNNAMNTFIEVRKKRTIIIRTVDQLK